MTDYDNILKWHSIIGTRQGKQGAGQTVPEDIVLCYSCGWMRCSEYHNHLVQVLEEAE